MSKRASRLRPALGRTGARLELVAKNSSLTACFFDGDLHIPDRGREILPHLAFNLSGNIFSQQLCARVGNRQKDDVAAGQEKLLFFVEYLDRLGTFAHLYRRAVRLYQSPMIESVADLFDQRFESNEVQHDARSIQFTFHGNRHLVVVSVQRLSVAVSKDQKVGRCEIEIVFRDFDAETAWHEREG